MDHRIIYINVDINASMHASPFDASSSDYYRDIPIDIFYRTILLTGHMFNKSRTVFSPNTIFALDVSKNNT
jgi:cytochrome oxidase assembly protein ShyY1